MNVLSVLVLLIVVVNGNCVPTTFIPSTTSRSTVKSSVEQRSLTIHNHCGDEYAVYHGAQSLPVPDHCLNGAYCTDFSHTNPAFWIARKGFSSLNFGARTLVEFNFMDKYTVWWDISLVKGFNVGARIVAKLHNGHPASIHPETICTHVNCKDAYWVCDTAWNNLFHPVYNTFGSEGVFEVTFCPKNVTDTEPLHKVTQKRIVKGEAPFYCACTQGVTPAHQLVPSKVTKLTGNDCGPIYS